MPAIAAQLYFSRREQYRNALATIETIADPEVRYVLAKALTAHVRRVYRGISTGLTTRMGCRLSTLSEGYEGPVHVEHAVPLRLIHNRLLGITQQGAVDPDAYDLFPDPASIQDFVEAFIVGVKVTPAEHAMLNAHNMHGEWDWLHGFQPWNWNELAVDEWEYANRPLWLISLMNRYENVATPNGPLKYSRT